MAAPRLHLDQPLSAGAEIVLDGGPFHYLTQVMRSRAGGAVRLFNTRDGEWSAVVSALERRSLRLEVRERLRPASILPGPLLALAPIRPSRLDWMVEKAVELGVGGFALVVTERTIVRPERADRLRGIVREAAEQCERLDLPPVAEPLPLTRWLSLRDPSRRLLLADETGGARASDLLTEPGPPPDLLVGPEGGFSEIERRLIAAVGGRSLTLGPTILRAETAGLALIAAWRVLAADTPAEPGPPAEAVEWAQPDA